MLACALVRSCEAQSPKTGTHITAKSTTTWGVQVVRYPNFFSGMEADRNVKVVGGDVAVL